MAAPAKNIRQLRGRGGGSVISGTGRLSVAMVSTPAGFLSSIYCRDQAAGQTRDPSFPRRAWERGVSSPATIVPRENPAQTRARRRFSNLSNLLRRTHRDDFSSLG